MSSLLLLQYPSTSIDIWYPGCFQLFCILPLIIPWCVPDEPASVWITNILFLDCSGSVLIRWHISTTEVGLIITVVWSFLYSTAAEINFPVVLSYFAGLYLNIFIGYIGVSEVGKHLLESLNVDFHLL